MILPGVFIGDDVVIGAGSVVTHDVASGSVAAGNPARVICTIQSYLNKRKEQMSVYPCFGAEFTAERKLTKAMERAMNDAMKDRFGFVV